MNDAFEETEISDDVLSMVADQAENNAESNMNMNTNMNMNSNSVATITRTLDSVEDRKCFIKEKFLVDMPDDFYHFWTLCAKIRKDRPKEAFKDIGLMLVGPYDVLDESFRVGPDDDEKYLLHWRYYYDPPEFQVMYIFS